LLTQILNRSGEACRFVGRAAEDTTAMKVLEQEYAEAQGKHQDIIDALQDILMVLDLEGKVLNCNRQAEVASGYSKGEILGQSALAFFREQESSIIATALTTVLQNGCARAEAHLLSKDGASVPCQWSGWALRSEGGQVTAICAVIRDISERVRLEEELRRAKETAESASRAKSEFLDVMSHELRTPLNAVLGFSQLLAAQSFGQLNERQAKYVDHILASGKHLLELVSEILDLVEIESGSIKLTRSPFDVDKTIHDMVSRAESWIGTHAAQKGIALKVECAEDLPLIMADQPKFKKILHNLLSNAIKFTDEGGSICLTAHRIDDFGLRVVDLLKQGAHIGVEDAGAGAGYPRSAIAPAESAIEIVLTDTGVGIRAGDLVHIFEEFRQADSSSSRRHRGMGLGLALTRRLIELHGGYIWAESAGEDRGSTFSFLLPTGLDE
jgi:PAS domain S-box-containing protein